MEPATVSLPSGEYPLPRSRRRRVRQIFLIALCALMVFAAWFVPPVYKLKHGPVTVTRFTKKQGETQATVGPGQKGWISLDKVSRHAIHAIIASEDGRFYEHHGLDFEAIHKSYEINKKKKRYARGASTLSQQVVKMAFLSREKTLVRKAREAVGTLLMELILPKDKILEWYVNMAEFGDGVYGIQEGSWHYFKTKPELLTIEQGVHLALVLPSPNAWSRGLRVRTLTPFGHRRFAAILNTMRSMGFVTKTQWTSAITRGDFGRPVHGYAEMLAAEDKNQTLCPGSPDCPDVPEDEQTDGNAVDDDDATPAAPAPSPAATAVATPVPAAAPAPSPIATPTATPTATQPETATDTPTAVAPAAVDPAPAPVPAPEAAPPANPETF
jgi:monofunctional biosynthetic peptidoglycan transglycosylase